MNLLEKGIEKGLIRFDEDRNFITYIHQSKKRNYNNPEEKVQASTLPQEQLLNSLSKVCQSPINQGF